MMRWIGGRGNNQSARKWPSKMNVAWTLDLRAIGLFAAGSFAGDRNQFAIWLLLLTQHLTAPSDKTISSSSSRAVSAVVASFTRYCLSVRRTIFHFARSYCSYVECTILRSHVEGQSSCWGMYCTYLHTNIIYIGYEYVLHTFDIRIHHPVQQRTCSHREFSATESKQQKDCWERERERATSRAQETHRKDKKKSFFSE